MRTTPLPDALAAAVEASLGAASTAAARLGGGDVAEAFRVDLADGRTVFAKTRTPCPPGFFTTEALGLRWLADAEAVPVPEVLLVDDDVPVLVLSWVREGRAGPDTEVALGRELAALHRAGAPCFGRADRRSTGSRGLPNDPHDTWAEAFARNRLLPLARLAADGGALSEAACRRVEAVAARVDAYGGGGEPPARLHGDLWAGNRLIDTSGRSWLIDPAAHGGHREFDLAMMRLFGGFGDDAFGAYDEVHPLAAGWRERIPLHQLSPLVVHAVKFGGPYPAAVDAALDRLL